MDETPASNGQGIQPLPPMFVAETRKQPSTLRKVFLGPNGLRAGWRLLIYVAVIFLITKISLILRGSPKPKQITVDEPISMMKREWRAFAYVAFAGWIMSRIERRPWGSYGMPWRNAFRSRFWIGAVFGFVALSCVMGALHLAGCYYIDGLALHGSEVWKFAGLWLVGFLGVGFFEEFLSRGYGQFTLASGIGFWWAAVVTSGLFLAAHVGNPGETALGLTDVFLFGMLACLIWWRTGDLWLAVGFHAFWDWGLSFFYSVPDSGVPAVGHLFNSRVQGPAWLSGGSAGPEGSIINIAFDLLYFVIIAYMFPKKQFVGINEDRKTPPVAPASNPTLIDSSALSS